MRRSAGLCQTQQLIKRPCAETFLQRASLTFVRLLPRKALLAIAVVVDVALQMERRPISAKTLAMGHGLGPRHLETMLRSLVHDRILKGVRGPHGGYEFARDRNAVTLSDILRALGIGDPEDKPKSETVTTIVLPALSLAQHAFEQTLNEINLDELVRYAKSVDMDRDVTKVA
jgi:Rrf2 family transcriptional regulator, iron-sulfur cluster assembly transcription factor